MPKSVLAMGATIFEIIPAGARKLGADFPAIPAGAGKTGWHKRNIRPNLGPSPRVRGKHCHQDC